tara:strand:- start:3779 stop:5797 length:2019 start_codon:yes stop_codon:yes gene_type:complete
MSSPDINYPAQPSYGEGLASALKAQSELLRGTGDFAETGSLESLLPLERRIREQTAQTDTDILRRTLLGREQRVVQDPETGRFGIRGGEVATDDQGQAIEAGGGRYQLVKLKEAKKERGTYGRPDYQSASNAQYGIVDTKTGGFVQGMLFGGQDVFDRDDEVSEMSILADATKEMRSLQGIIDDAGGDANAVAESFTFTDPNTGEPLEEGQTVRTTTGMVDLLGDRRQLLGEDRTAGFDESGQFLGLSALTEDIGQAQLSRRRERDLADVERLAPRYKDVMDVFRDENLMTSIGEVGGMQDVFMRDMMEQRDRGAGDTAPVTAKDDPYQFMLNEIMADQQSDLAQLAEQEAGGRVFDPNMTADTIQDEYVSRMNQLREAFPEQAQGVAGDVGDAGPMGDAGDPFTARLAQAGTPQGAGLRETLTNEALLGLQDGLTDREERQIAEAARARATMMGRTFDQSEAIKEAQARVLEDNQRRMQNRAFAQNVLGQEAGTRFRELALRQQNQLDPFTAILGRPGAPTTGQASQILGQAGYGLESGPQYLNPEAGLGYISQMAANEANVAAAQAAAKGSAQSGLFGGLGALGGGLLSGAGAAASGSKTLFSGFCWVAREVYGMHNPAWLLFREWMLNESPSWFRTLYLKFGERFAKFISDKPRIKARIRLWMDTKIRR